MNCIYGRTKNCNTEEEESIGELGDKEINVNMVTETK
jgi:hypothetical protein